LSIALADYPMGISRTFPTSSTDWRWDEGGEGGKGGDGIVR
jgi:hypothetical protein